jgi:hypothetical protein
MKLAKITLNYNIIANPELINANVNSQITFNIIIQYT